MIPGQTRGGWICFVCGHMGLMLTGLSGSLYTPFVVDTDNPKGLHLSVDYLRILLKDKVCIVNLFSSFHLKICWKHFNILTKGTATAQAIFPQTHQNALKSCYWSRDILRRLQQPYLFTCAGCSKRMQAKLFQLSECYKINYAK